MFEEDVAKEPEYVKSVEPDFIKLMNDGYFTYKFGNVKDPKNLESLAKIKPIDDDDPWLKNQFKLISRQLNDLDGSAITLSNVFSAVTLFKWALVVDSPDEDLSKADKLFADLYTESPEVVINALNVIKDDIKKQIQVEHAAGVKGVLFSTQEIQDERIGQSFFNETQKKLDTELIDEINKYFKTGILHICGFDGATNHLPWFVDYKLPIVNWATKIDGYLLGQGKKLFKDKVVFGGLGNTTNDVLFKGDQKQIQAEIDDLIAEAGVKGVIIGADCTVPRETPVEHIRWAAEAAHSYLVRKKQNK
ncbi:hypothetical protein FC19_GL002138 [Liquorilactobacillus aquaticus DSM 21051]|uniref:Uroporphyrinogen decarboxylase (URO-D) domain-containing protein n=1 Tax=Liquorilactobacillus aquaticus DSM 21051 TaxID=1423725 RepID=A0A0R2D3Z0_9LACO|nr:uroporphyrinogen decarboxylase family protein [Liquorilactobacillus aquaticus]KRM95046.1 hypothetical protein FC19_GL002138 [Liquorilactobacillus aquaticus DSM 21051]